MGIAKTAHPGRALLFITNPTMILLATIILLLSWKIPTEVHLDLVLEYRKEDAFIHDAASIIAAIQRKTVLVKEGHLSYPDHPEITSIYFVLPGQLEISSGETGLQIQEEIRLSERHVRIRLEGQVNSLKIETSEQLVDRRLTQLDNVKTSPKLMWTGIGLWLVATIIGWIRVYQELKK